MAETDLSDDLSEWEQIQSSLPSHPQSASEWQINDDEVWPLFPPPPPQVPEPPLSRAPPPNEPNSLYPSSSSSSPTPPPESPSSPPAPPSSSSSTTDTKRDEEDLRRRSDWRLVAARELGKRLRLRLGILSAEVLRAASKVCNYRMIAGRFWSITSVAGVLTAVLLSLLYVKLRPRGRTRRVLRDDKERLILLVKEKDEKISQLLVQIAEMNEALSARRRVPVLRVS